ncbi:MAG: CaiB/BaiF CoA transferase family protein, partial [Dehalococcoidia bacterium]
AFIAGTFAPTVLANFGAEVIKVEPLDGDPFRPYGLNFIGHNLGKRSLALDLKHPEGRAVFEELVRQADVVLDNYRLGVRERLRVDYATLAAINPRIITCSVTGYGPKGELAKDPGFDPLMQARSGMMWAQGGADEPVFHQIAVNDTATAMVAAFGIQAAIHAREKTGRGQEVTTCLANQSVLFQWGEVTWYEGRTPSPVGGRDFIGESAVRRFYRCADGWLCLACTTPQHFHQTCIALGRPDLAARTIAEKARSEPNDGALATALAEIFAGMTRDEAVDRLRSRDVPAAPSLTPAEVFADPWLRENAHLQESEYPLFGPITTVRGYGRFSRTPGGFAYPAPMPGEHSLDILAEFGIDAVRVARLVELGVVGV